MLAVGIFVFFGVIILLIKSNTSPVLETNIKVEEKNKTKDTASYKTKIGDVITYEKIIKDEEKLIPEDLPLDVIYEDNDILVINKAKGMVVHPGNGNHSGTLANAIMSYSKDSLSGIGGKLRPRHSS